uniref:T4 family peptidase n=1 Tax=uncultured organism TaxID=155900 RepID=M1PW42_9ZZZZ|nr:T4 family peptidase [uncultured organism]
MKDSITEIEGIKVGHASNFKAQTGCTVVRFDKKFQGSCEVRGGAPGTRETALLEPTAAMDQIHAILLTGGSAFGLNAAGGVMKFLEEENKGFPTGAARVPIVPGAVIFDLAYGNSAIRPDADMGYEACKNAGDNFERGSVGAGTGATVGKIKGMKNCMKSGLGTASRKKGDLIVGALTVCNAFGDIYDYKNGSIIAGARDEAGNFINSKEELIKEKLEKTNPGENTTLVVLAVNADINKNMCKKIAEMAQDGLARTLAPVHTMLDGDTIFSVSSNQVKDVDVSVLGTMAAEAVADSVINCIP